MSEKTPFDDWWEQLRQGAENDPCIWTEDEDGLWSGPYGVAWQFNEGGPEQNKCIFCLRCGRKIEPDPYTDEDEGEEI